MRYEFNADIGKVLQLVVHSIYTNKDIFLRELVSNASDACDKLRYLSIEHPEYLHDNSELKITISFDEKDQTITISDNGIGMSEQELVENLGTIARSGTQEFLQNILDQKKTNNISNKNKSNELNQNQTQSSSTQSSATTVNDVPLIGQFGVGFYSAFIVANEVKVYSRKVGSNEVYCWTSTGTDAFSVEQQSDIVMDYGTKIVLHIKAEEVEFLDKHKLKHILTTYSDHVAFPIEFIDGDGKAEIVNDGKALWYRSKNEITPHEYNEFYRYISHTPDTPWMVMHNKIEGAIEYICLLFIPGTKPFDLFHPDRKARVKLYIKRVFITDEGLQLVPAYMRFLRGIIDSSDLPLNISREVLQNNYQVTKIRKSIVKKVLSELKNRAEKDNDEYMKFWNNFGEVLKEGLCESALAEKEDLLGVCKFHSLNSLDNVQIGIDAYIEKMLKGQDDIFYIVGDNLDVLKNNPQLEGFRERGIDVLLLKDHVDSFWVHVVHEYKKKQLRCTSDSGLDLSKICTEDSDKVNNEKNNDDNQINDVDRNKDEILVKNKKLTEYIKNVLSNYVKDVVISTKLVNSPACLSLPEGAMGVKMEQMLIEQKQLHKRSKKILEINPRHELLRQIKSMIDVNDICDVGCCANDNTEKIKNLIYMLFYQACLIESEPIADMHDFVKRLNWLLGKEV